MFHVEQCGQDTYLVKRGEAIVGGLSVQPDAATEVTEWIERMSEPASASEPAGAKVPEFAVKLPDWGAINFQQQANAGLNPFAVTLLAESFARRREEAGNGTMFLVGWGKDERPVYILVTSAAPDWLPAEIRAGLEAGRL